MFVLISCEQEAEIDIPHPKERIVLNAILQEGELFKLHLSKSSYALDTVIRYVDNAVVNVFSEDTLLEVLKYSQEGFYYSDQLIVKEGVCYSVEVLVPGYNNLLAHTCVPSPVRLQSVSLKTDAGKDNKGISYSLVEISFKDPVNTENYYYISLISRNLDTFYTHLYRDNAFFFSYSPIILAEGDKSSKVFSDKTFNGQEVLLPLNYYDFKADTVTKRRLTLKLFSVSESFYLYQKSLAEYQKAINDIFRVNNPPQLYSNVENAYGIFSAVAVSDSINIDYNY